MKKLTTLIAIVAIVSLQKLDAQVASFQWLNASWDNAPNFPATGNGGGESIEVDQQGNVYTSGGLYFNWSNIRVSKFNSNGNLIWNFSLPAGAVATTKIKLDGAGNFYMAGRFRNTIDMNPGAGIDNITADANGHDDIYLAKYDTAGNFIWAFSVGSPEYDYCYDLALDNSGNPIIVGSFLGTVDFNPSGATNSLTPNQQDGFIAKYSSSGNYIFAKQIRGISQAGIGGYGISDIYAVSTDNSNNIYVGGAFILKCNFDFGNSNFIVNRKNGRAGFFAKYDVSANLIYVKTLNEGEAVPHYNYNVEIDDMAVDGNNNISVCGVFSDTVDFNPSTGVKNLISSNGFNDAFVAQYDNNGIFRWAKQIPYGGNSVLDCKNIAADNSSNVYVHYDYSINPIAVLRKYNSIGAIVFDYQGYTCGTVGEVELDNNSNFYFTGLSGGYNGYAGDFDFSPNVQPIPYYGSGIYPPFIAKYHECSACSNPVTTLSNLTSTSVKVNWNIIDCAYQYQLQYTDSGSSSWTTKKMNDPIIQKKLTGLSPSTTYQYRIRTQCDNSSFSSYSAIQYFTTNALRESESDIESGINDLYIYPNPANDVLNISFQSETTSIRAEVINITGQVVYQNLLHGNDENYNHSINIIKLASGIYQLRLIDANGIGTRRFIKQ